MSKFWDKLGTEHLVQLANGGIFNFRRTVACRYFTDKRKDNFNELKKIYNSLVDRGIKIDIEDSNIGNPFVVDIDGHNVSQDLLVSLNEIGSIGNFDNIKKIVEIGSGYGRTAYAILKKYPKIKYTIIDIPPAIDLSRKFLTESLPDADISFLSPKDNMPEADLFIAISIFSELTPEEVNKYLSKIKGKFYLKDWEYWYNPIDDVTVNEDNYRPKDWKVIFKRKDPITEGFFEALYET